MLQRILEFIFRLLGKAPEIPSPGFLIDWSQIEVRKVENTAELTLKGIPLPFWIYSNPHNTNSMDGSFDLGHAPIITGNKRYIRTYARVGAWISWAKAKVARFHQIIEVGEDKDGWYCKTMGLNVGYIDPWKVRYNEITGIVLGILWTALDKEKNIYLGD